ncbi:MAG: bifunctional riboflavin kinase/FAD synthetase [Lachnospiraceae bacterium]|nr:bifunctional riboflavin kinase/FAD synthetase [Lachnospiraceae bacterium]
MEIIKGIDNYLHKFPTAVTVGKFDGIHLGHEALVSLITSQTGLKSVMVTFGKSPKKVLFYPDMKYIITEEERNIILEKNGVDVLLVLDFDEALMHQSPEDFIQMLSDRINMRYLAVGSDFTFGYKGAGNAALLKELSGSIGFDLNVIEKIQNDGRDISSTRIRELISEGNVSEAGKLLGHPYIIAGPVVHGRHLGTRMGIPTINLRPAANKLLPPFGVYITTVEIEGRVYHGITNVGNNPTVSDDNPITIETNILDATGNLYEERATVIFHEYLRPEQKFDSLDDLTTEVRRNISQARDYFNHHSS